MFRVSSSLLFLAPQPPGWKKVSDTKPLNCVQDGMVNIS